MAAPAAVAHRDGGYGVAGTRVSLDSLVDACRDGQTADSLAPSFPGLTVAQGDGAMASSLAHHAVIDASLRPQEVALATLQQDLRHRDPRCSQKRAAARRHRQTPHA